MGTSIKDQVKNIFNTNAFETALELTKVLRGEYIRELGVKSWNALASYYMKANIQPEISRVGEPENRHSKILPLKQYFEMKKKHPDAILLFRIGDFYETFSMDAVEDSEILSLTLSRRMNGKADPIELVGFPHHALDTYLPKLIRAGKRVAICEQLDDSDKEVKVLETVSSPENTTPSSNEEKESEETVAESIDYMIYRNVGDTLEWFGHKENFYGHKEGHTHMIIRNHSCVVSEAVIVASKPLTYYKIALFHQCYKTISKKRCAYVDQLEQILICLNNLSKMTNEDLSLIPKADTKMTEVILNFQN